MTIELFEAVGPVVFRRSEPYNETYSVRVLPYPKIRTKFREFMDIKRNYPNKPFGQSDTTFTANGNFIARVPGLKHAHITNDISIVYKVEGNEVFLYGFYPHDDLGTGTPAKINVQKAMAARFANTQFN